MNSPKHHTDLSAYKAEFGIKLLITYALIFGLYIYVTNAFFSISAYITGVVIVLWAMTLFLAIRIPAERSASVKQGKNFILGYFLFLLMFRMIIGYFYSLNPASLGQAISPNVSQFTSATMQASIENMLQNVFLISSISAPVGYAITMWQKIRHHRIKTTMHGGLTRYKGFRDNEER